MADLRRIIEVVFAGRDELSPVSQRTALSFGAITTAAAAAAAAVLALEAAQISLAKAMITTGFEAAAKYEASLGDLTKVLDEQEKKALPQIEAALKSLSLTYASSINDVVKSAAGWRAAGFDADEAIKLTEATLRSMVVSDQNAEEATAALLKIIKGLELTASDAIPVLDTFNAVSDASGASNKLLFEAISLIAPQAKLAGFSIQELTAFLTPGIEKFQSGAAVAEAFKTTIGNLVAPTKDVSAGLKTLGVALTDSSGEARSIKDVLFDVSKAYGKLDDSQKLVVAGQLAGSDQAARLTGILADNTKTLELLDVANRAAGSSTEEFAKKASQAVFSVDQLKSRFEQLTISVGQQFYKAAQGTINGLGELTTAFDNAVAAGNLQPFFDQVTKGLQNAEAEFRALAQDVPGILNNLDFTAFNQSISDLFLTAFGDKTLDPVQNAARVVQSLIDIFTDANNALNVFLGSTRAVINAFESIFNAVAAGVSAALYAFLRIVDFILPFKMEVMTQSIEIFRDVARKNWQDAVDDFDELKRGLEQASAGIVNIFDPPKKSIEQLGESFTRLRGLISEGGDPFKSTPFVSALAEWGQSLDTFGEKVKKAEPFTPLAINAQKTAESVKKSLDNINEAAKIANDRLRILADLAKEEIKAKVAFDVAKIQAQANIIIATINSVAEQAKAAATAISAIGGQIGDQAKAGATISSSVVDALKVGSKESVQIANQLVSALFIQLSLQRQSIGLQEREVALQERLEKQTRELTEAQTKYLQEKAKRLASGKGVEITFDATAVTPALRQLLNETLKEIQAIATDDGAEFLLGIA